MYRKTLLLLLLIVSCQIGFSQVIIQEDTVECSIYFHQGKSYFDPVYKDNGKRLKEFVNDVYFRSDDPSMSIKRIVVNSGASPEVLNELMMRPDQIATDIGSVLAGEEAVRYGIIDAVGGLTDALEALREMINK
mgnify:CR=1 FL=1